MERFDSCFHPHHACDPHPNEYHENIHYTPDQINALLGLIPYKADRAEVPKMETLNDVNYIGHVATSEALPDKMEQPSWALVGSVKKTKPYFYYVEGFVPKGYRAGWNDLSGVLGTYDLTVDKVSIFDYNLLTEYNVSRNHTQDTRIFSHDWKEQRYFSAFPDYVEGKKYRPCDRVNMPGYTKTSFVAQRSTSEAPFVVKKSNVFTFEDAIALVPEEYRIPGMKVTFVSAYTNQAETWYFKGNSASLWKDKKSWWKIDLEAERNEIHAEEVFIEKMEAPEMVADRAIADENGNRIPDTYLTRKVVRRHIEDTFNDMFIDNPPTVMDGMITPEMLSESTKQLIGNKNITNFADDEDITSVHGQLKLANKKYDPNNYSGMGRQFLRKNLVAGRNILTQSMICWSDTIYVIQYNYDLDGDTIEIPENSVLEFHGGHITNGIVKINGTLLTGIQALKDGISCTVTGTYAIGQILFIEQEDNFQYFNGQEWKMLGRSPFIKNMDNKLYYSYNNKEWFPCSEYIAAWFRFQNNKFQISRDNSTWSDLSEDITNSLHIKGYVANISELPSDAVQGDIYMVGPDYEEGDDAHKNPLYYMYVKNHSKWVNNGRFQSFLAGIVQELGDSETDVISQKTISLNIPYDVSLYHTNTDGTNKFTLSEAIYNIPTSIRRHGSEIRFISNSTGRYETWKFIFNNEITNSEWNKAGNWVKITTDFDISVIGNLNAINSHVLTISDLERYYWENVDGKAVFSRSNPNIPLYSSIIKCKTGDKFYLQNNGEGNAKNWFKTSTDLNILEESEAVKDSFIIEMEEDGYLIVNHNQNNVNALFFLLKIKNTENLFVEKGVELQAILTSNCFLKDYYFILENGKTLFCRHNIPGEISTILFEAKKDTAIYSKSCGFSRGIPLIVLDRDRNVIYSEPNDNNIRRATYYKMPEDGYIIVNNADGTIPDKYIRVLNDKPFYTIDDFNKGYWEVNLTVGFINTWSNPNLNILNTCIPCKKGDKFRISTYGWQAARPYYITDNSKNVLERGPMVSSLFQSEIEITQDNATFLVVNYREFPNAGKVFVERLDTVYTNRNVKYITCLGDSLTVGYQSGVTTSYPEVLNSALGNNWKIINGGYDADSIEMILGRQGSNVLLNKNQIVLPADGSGVQIGTLGDSGIISALTPDNSLPLQRWAFKDTTRGLITPVMVNNVLCNLLFTGTSYNDNNGRYMMSLVTPQSTPVTIPANSVISTALRTGVDSDVLVIWMGTNGLTVGGSFTPEQLVDYHNMAINYAATKKTIIIGLHTGDLNSRKTQEEVMQKAFGLRYINLRKYMVEQGLVDAGLEPTQEDTEFINQGKCPPQLLMDGTHFTTIGYTLVGKLVYQRGIALGYW